MHKLAIAYLRENKGRWPDIADETGLGYQWLSKLAQGNFTDPGVNKVERLLRYAGLMTRVNQHGGVTLEITAAEDSAEDDAA